MDSLPEVPTSGRLYMDEWIRCEGEEVLWDLFSQHKRWNE